MTEVDEYLTTRDVSAMLGLPDGTVRKMRRTGKGPEFVSFDGPIRYRRSVVEAYIAEKEAAAAERRAS